MPKPHSSEMVLDQATARARAIFELSFEKPKALGAAQGALIRVHWVHANPSHSRILLIGADLSRLRSGSGDAGAIASAMAFKVRSGLLERGARFPPGYVNDFPSAPMMASADVAACTCAVGWPESMDAKAMLEASLASVEGMFLEGSIHAKHIKAELAPQGDLERAANHIITELRQARVARGESITRNDKEPNP